MSRKRALHRLLEMLARRVEFLIRIVQLADKVIRHAKAWSWTAWFCGLRLHDLKTRRNCHAAAMGNRAALTALTGIALF